MGRTRRKQPSAPRLVKRHGHGGNPPVLKVVDGIADAESRTRGVVKRNTNHCTLCRLHHLGHLKDRPSEDMKQSNLRHAAGEKLQDDHSLAGLSSIPSTLGGTPRGGSYGPVDISQIRIDAAGRKRTALGAVGRTASFLLEKIVIEDLTLAETAQIMQVKDNAVLPALRVALDALAAHYGIIYAVRAAIRGGPAQPVHPFQQFD